MAIKQVETEKRQTAQITAPNLQVAIFGVVGVSPYVQHKFSAKARREMMTNHEAGSQAKTKKKREQRDFAAEYLAAMHISMEGWCGIPAPSFRNAMIDACRLVQFKMTFARLSIFIIPDGFDVDDGTPLVKIVGDPEKHEASVRLESGVCSVVVRPMWRRWSCDLRVSWDLDQFSLEDVSNLLERAGQQVGIGEGRNCSRKSNGVGWGCFTVAETAKAGEKAA
jgi:hypothetical protein